MNDDAIAIPVRAIRAGLVLLVVVALVGVTAFLLPQLRDRMSGVLSRGLAAQIDESRFQSVRLTGGEVFFGRLAAHGDVFLMSDVFYLTPAPEGSSEAGTLVKRGGELHGPTEPLVIAERHIAYMENLREDSQVVQAIRRFRSGETTPPATPRPSTPAPRATPTRSP